MFSFFKSKSKKVPSLEPKVVEDFENVKEISEYFHKETGVTFDRQESILKNKVISFCRQNSIYSFSDLLTNIKNNSELRQGLIDHLTTNETYFYREVKQMDELVQLVKDAKKSVRILCAPSATGEEPYSIAIKLLEAGVSPGNIEIQGIDINSEAIQKAKIAVYGERNVRNLSVGLRNKYFTQIEDKYALKESVKSIVNFRVANIFDDDFKSLGKFDFVFSRNMLIYFDKETKLRAKRILEDMRKNDEHCVFFGHADLY
jgi:chemotaxis protein methyltransferase CheR